MRTDEMTNEKWDKITEDEYLKFDRIPKEERLSSYPDICGLLYIEKRFGESSDNTDMICGADHDIFWVGTPLDKLTKEDAIYLARCGAHWDIEVDYLAFFA